MKLVCAACMGVLLLCVSVVSASLTDGLVAFYPFDGNANDASGNGRHGTVFGATLTHDQNGNPNSAYEFDGVSNYIRFGPVLPDMERMTVALWLFIPAPDRVACIFSDGEHLSMKFDQAHNIKLVAKKNGARLEHGFDLYESLQSQSRHSVTNRWIHLVWVMTEHHSVVYVDGVARGQYFESASNVGGHDLVVGAAYWGGWSNPPANYFWRGTISSMRVYNRALSGPEILSLYEGGGRDDARTEDSGTQFVIDTFGAEHRKDQWLGRMQDHGGYLAMGQTITAPDTHPVLDLFAFYVKSRYPDIPMRFRGYVMSWDGRTAQYPVLWQSPLMQTHSTGGEAVEFHTGGLTLDPGARYILFLGVLDGAGWATMSEGADVYPYGSWVASNGHGIESWAGGGWHIMGAGANMWFRAEFSKVSDENASFIYVEALPVRHPVEDGTREHPYNSIQRAIEASDDGQTIVVGSGTYFETINFLGKNITVTGFDPDILPEDRLPGPVIDGGHQDTVVTFASGESAEARLSGFVITRGEGTLAGGILCSGGSPVITDCLIVGNRSALGGGGIYCINSEAVFDTCTISGNYGGLVGAGFYTSGNKSAVLTNSILWGNTPVEIGFPVFGAFEPLLVTYSNVGIEVLGEGNIYSDPLFVAPGHWARPHDPTSPVEPVHADAIWIDGDYRLQSLSPCIDAGDPMYAGDAFDLDGRPRVSNERVDMGAYEYPVEPGSPDTIFVADYEGTSILLVPDSTALHPEQTYVGEATIHLDALFKLRLLAQAFPVSAAGGTWTVLLEPEIVGPGIGIEIVISVRGEGVDVSKLATSTGEFVLVEVEVGAILAQ